MIDYYEILEISHSASQETIKAAYKSLVRKYHPDNNVCKKDEKMMEYVNIAYDTLSNPDKRIIYDMELKRKNLSEQSNKDSNVNIHNEKKEFSKSDVNDKNEDLKDEEAARKKQEAFDKLPWPVKVISVLIYLLGYGIYYGISIVVIIFIIGLFTGHTQRLLSGLLSYIGF